MITYYGLRIGILLATYIPSKLAYWFCSLVGTVSFYTNGPARRAVQDNMRHVLGADVPARRLNKVCRQIFRNMVKNYYELLCLPRLKPADLEKRVQVQGIEHVHAALKKGRGAILFS